MLCEMSSDLATVEVARRDGVRVATLAGEIDLSNATSIGQRLIAASGGDPLVVDLSPLEYVDSAGIAMFYDIARRLGEDRVRLVVTPAAIVRRTLTVAGVDTSLPMEATIEAAVTGILAGAPGPIA
jgi:anti-sigma B factor antagonist